MDKEKALERLKAIEDETKELRKIIDNPNIVYPAGMNEPKEDSVFWSLGFDEVLEEWWNCEDYNTDALDRGNVYLDESTVEKADERRVIATSIKRYIVEINHDEAWVCDWKDEDQRKYHPVFRHCHHIIGTDFSLSVQNLDTEWHTYENGWNKVRKKFTDKEIAFAVWGIEID